ncbi:DUF2381 family protein [Archangium sp.]|uniref:DUF2381 family protein n=1 Tax=Archangium sp. TaxID=1872627 RepID=UPI002D570740|nr:DUF2381 family protein [Archangium sp.]HYO52512.1 DUF2381 family protein [Archangium sp.]
MPAVFPAALLAVAFLTGAAEAAERPPLPECDAPKLRVDLTPEATRKALEVCVNPDFPTTFKFNSPLPPGTVVEVQPENRFAESRGPQILTFIPREDYLPGERVKVTLRFADGAAPASVTFILVGHPARAVTQVQVFRHARPVEVCQQEVREARAEARQCQEENARLRAERGRPDGLRGLFDAGLMNREGIRSRGLGGKTSSLEGNALTVEEAFSYRTEGLEQGGRVAVLVLLSNPGAPPWTVAGAALSGPTGEELTLLPLWHTGPIHPGTEWGQVVVEVEATGEQAKGTYTLKLWDAEGRTITLGKVTFP